MYVTNVKIRINDSSEIIISLNQACMDQPSLLDTMDPFVGDFELCNTRRSYTCTNNYIT